MSIRELAGLIQRHQVSVGEVVRSTIARIERVDPQLNSFITLAADRALAAARTADEEIARGGYRGALHGVPVGIKDHIDTAGIVTTAGSGLFRSRTPGTDAPVVRTLEAAGVIIIGKANMNEFAVFVSKNSIDSFVSRSPMVIGLSFQLTGTSTGPLTWVRFVSADHGTPTRSRRMLTRVQRRSSMSRRRDYHRDNHRYKGARLWTRPSAKCSRG